MAEQEIQKRQIAYKVRIKDILKGTYVKDEGWNPNYIELSGKKISRINIIGVVIDKQQDADTGYTSIQVDDSTASISARVFGEDTEKLKDINVGEVVLIIGRPREYGSERYLALEIIKKMNDKQWIEVRKQELEKESPAVEESVVEPVQESPVLSVQEEPVESTLPDKIIEFIRNNDQGEGVNFEDIVKECDDENIIKNLLNEGELFEIKPGRLKVLE